MPPTGLVLDVNETLFALGPLAHQFEAVGLPPGQVSPWFASVLTDGFALAATGTAAPFGQIGRFHLARLLRGHGLAADEDVLERVLAAFADVEPHADVADGLRTARARGLSVATLTNGTRTITQAVLDRAGVSDLVDAVLEAAASGVWKPHAQAYRWAADQLHRPVGELTLVAVHPWDVHGAIMAGLGGAWLDRDGGDYPDYFQPPDARAATLPDLVAAITSA